MVYPRVGVGVFVFDEQRRLLLGQRKGSHGAGTYALPGGHLEFNESFSACAIREVLEEGALVVDHVRFLTATNNIMREDSKHYITIFVGVEVKKGSCTEPKTMEPEKCRGWEWVEWSDVEELAREEIAELDMLGGKRRLFSPLVDLVKQEPRFDPRTAWENSRDLQE